jgi:LytS/YehU family sensor histidine kinase
VLGRLTNDPFTGARFDHDIPIFFVAGILLFTLAAAVHYLLIAFEASRAAERRALELQVLARDAQLEALQAQVNPHFLFNSLNAISSLTTSEPAAARRMCLLLASFLRRSLALGPRRVIHLQEEMSLVDDFLAIETVRFGSRLRVERYLQPGTEECLLPPLVLQPLIENAVNHGIATLLDGGTVVIRARIEGGRLILAVENPFDPESRSPRGQGLGIKNVRARLAAIHGSAAHVAVTSSGARFHVDVSLPAVTEPARLGSGADALAHAEPAAANLGPGGTKTRDIRDA